jgi:integrase
MGTTGTPIHREPWNKGKLVGQKAPFKLKDIWALRVRLQMEGRVRELALFNLGIDSKLRGCDLVALKVRDVCHGDQVATRAVVMQHKTQRPVQFEITQATRDALQAWIKQARLKSDDFLFPSRLHDSPHLGTRQYARILGHWVDELGLDRAEYGNALDAKDQGDADLQAHQESACRSAAPWTFEARVDRAIPRHRGR